MRTKELCSLRLCDVLDKATEIRGEIYFATELTKGRSGRTVILGKMARVEGGSMHADHASEHLEQGQRWLLAKVKAEKAARQLKSRGL